MTRIDELLQQREAIDAELRALHADAQAELEQAQERLNKVAAALSLEQMKAANQTARHSESLRQASPLDETDAGHGIGLDRDTGHDAESFKDELAELRARSVARRMSR